MAAAQPPAPGGPGPGFDPPEPWTTTQVTLTELLLYVAQDAIYGTQSILGAFLVRFLDY